MSHALREAFAGIRRTPVLILVSILAVGLGLFVLGLFGLAAFNIRAALEEIEERVEVVAYLRDGTTPEQVRVAEAEIGSLPEVERVRYVSKTEALAVAIEELPEFREVFSGIEVNPLPGSFEIRLRPEDRTPESIERLAQHVLTYPFVEDANFGREWLEKLVALQRIAGGATLIVGGAFAAVAGIIIATAVQVAVSARKEEIEIMRLVGATDGFIRSPYLIEGLVAGFLGGILALLLTYVAYQFVSTAIVPVSWLPGLWLTSGVLAGATYGLLASAVAVKRYLGAA